MLLNVLQKNARTYARKPAIIHHDEHTTITYETLWRTVETTAAYLQQQGVKTGDRVALYLPKSLAFITLHLAVLRLNAISLPLNPAFTPDELEYYLRDAEVVVLVADVATKAPLSAVTAAQRTLFVQPDEVAFSGDTANLPPLPADEDATALMIYTSGTTGRPKGAEVSHRNLSATLTALHQAWAWQPDDHLLHALPVFHTHGLVVALHGALHAGASVTFVKAFNAERILALLASQTYSVFMGVPTMHARLLQHAQTLSSPPDLSHMRLMTSGSAPLSAEVFKGFQQVFNVTLLERYGMSETGMNISNPYEGERRLGSVGLPLPGVQVRIADPDTHAPLPDNTVGEVQLKGANVFKGYWRQAEKTAASFTPDGWFKTGDLGLRETDGYITLKGRAKDLIISGGYNVYPPETERVLNSHPLINASAVIACPDPDWGERVTAVIEASDTLSEADIIAFCRERLAAYKCPKRVLVTDALPRNAMGKIQKQQLRQTYCTP